MKKIIAIVSLSALSAAFADTIVNEKFSADPLQNGWQIFGDTNLFQWDSTNQVLDVTWDSSQPNSYFYHPLGTTLTSASNFLFSFDLQISDAAIANYGFELAVGLLNYTNATAINFSRATGSDSPNLVEFAYFPDPNQSLPWGSSITAVMVDSDGTGGTNWARGGFLGEALPLNETLHIELIYHAATQKLHTTITCNGLPFASVPDAYFPAGFQGFKVDTLSINSYQDDGFGDSILAHGVMKNLVFASPLPVDTIGCVAAGQIQFASDTNWLYTLEQTADFQTWTPAAPGMLGNGTNLLLQATNLPDDKAFYRVRADLP